MMDVTNVILNLVQLAILFIILFQTANISERQDFIIRARM